MIHQTDFKYVKILENAFSRLLRVLKSKIPTSVVTMVPPQVDAGSIINHLFWAPYGLDCMVTNGEEITNAMIGNDVLAIYW